MVEISGRALVDALENGVSQVEGKAGRFPQVSGMQFVYDSTKPPGKRIQDVFIQREPVDLDRLYKVATVDYMLSGGDGYAMFKEGRVLLSPLHKIDLVSTVAAYLRKTSVFEASLEGRIFAHFFDPHLDAQFER